MRKFGADAFWLAVLLALILIMGALLISGDVILYLAPRMVPMVWFGCAVLIVLFVFQLLRMVQSLREKQTPGKARIGLLLFLVPVLMILTVVPNENTPGSLPNHTVTMVSLTNGSAAKAEHAVQADAETGFMPCVLVDEHAIYDSKADLFSEYLHNTVDELAGRTVTVYGFVYTDDSFPDNTVLVSRLMISCCAADASIVGFHVQVEDGAELAQSEWIRVTGAVQSISLPYYGSYYDFPVLTNGIIVRCDTPGADEVYIYP